MDLRHLRTFVTVAELGTVSKAALYLHIAQPALSRQISDLERELGLTLFDRVGRRLFLTGVGEQLLGKLPQPAGFRHLTRRAGTTAPTWRHRGVEGRSFPGADRNGFFDIPAPICPALSERAGEVDRGGRHRHAGSARTRRNPSWHQLAPIHSGR